MLKVINIEWATDNDHNLQNALPKEIDIPESINIMGDISNYISDETGFCNFGFDTDTTALFLIQNILAAVLF